MIDLFHYRFKIIIIHNEPYQSMCLTRSKVHAYLMVNMKYVSLRYSVLLKGIYGAFLSNKSIVTRICIYQVYFTRLK